MVCILRERVAGPLRPWTQASCQLLQQTKNSAWQPASVSAAIMDCMGGQARSKPDSPGSGLCELMGWSALARRSAVHGERQTPAGAARLGRSVGRSVAQAGLRRSGPAGQSGCCGRGLCKARGRRRGLRCPGCHGTHEARGGGGAEDGRAAQPARLAEPTSTSASTLTPSTATQSPSTGPTTPSTVGASSAHAA